MFDIFLAYDSSDEYWRLRFDDVFSHSFNLRLVAPGDSEMLDGPTYVQRLSQSSLMSADTVMVVLLGPKAFASKKLDWEIAAALTVKGSRPTGIVPIRLPNHEDHGRKTVNAKRLPIRIVDNLQSGFLKLYDWTESSKELESRLYAAEKDSRKLAPKIKNQRALMTRDMIL